MNEPELYQLQECVCEIDSILKLTCVSQECIGRRLCEFESYLIHMKVHLFICVLCLYIEFWSYNRDYGAISEVHRQTLFY